MKARLLSVSYDEYRNDILGVNAPTLNYSTAKMILSKSALHAWGYHPKGGGLEKAEKKYMSKGQILHATLLSKGAKAQIVDAKDWRTNAAKAQRDEALANGLIPLLPDDYQEVMKAATTITQQLQAKGITLDGKTELAMLWEEDGVLCRGCMDHFDPAPIHEITELKFTEWSLTNSSLRRLIRQMSYDIQVAAYTTGIRLITGEAPRLRWIFAEMIPPYQVKIARPSDLLMQLGMQKWERARNIWKRCLSTGVWEGYGDEEVEIDPELWELREYEMSVYPPTEVVGDPEGYVEPSDDPMWF